MLKHIPSRKLILLVTIISIFLFVFYIILIGQKNPKYEESYEKYNSVVIKAAKEKNPSRCDEINFGQDHGDYRTSVEESRYFCKADYAIETLDLEYCKTLDATVKYVGTGTQQDICLYGIKNNKSRLIK